MRVRLGVALACVEPALGDALASQPRPDALALTLQTWSDDAWLRLLDRDGAIGGRFGALGGLRRFQPTIGRDYQVDLLALRPSAWEDAEWRARPRGARLLTGSVDRTGLLTIATVRHAGSDGPWSGELRLDVEQGPETRRVLPRLGGARRWANGVALRAEATFPRHKPDLDLAVGVRLVRRRLDAAVDLAVLDVPNNYNYRDQNIAVGTPTPFPRGDTAVRVVGVQPVALRARLVAAPWRTLRTELQGATTSRSRAQVVTVTDSGTTAFVQRDAAGYAAALVQWTPAARVTVAALATMQWWEATRDSTALAATLADDRAADERTATVGALVVARPAAAWTAELQLLHQRRTESRTRRPLLPGTDYADRAWQGRLAVVRHFASGWRLGTTAALDDRAIDRGAGTVPARTGLAVRRLRVVIEPAWTWPGGTVVTGGVRFDWDLDGAVPEFRQMAGFQLRVLTHW